MIIFYNGKKYKAYHSGREVNICHIDPAKFTFMNAKTMTGAATFDTSREEHTFTKAYVQGLKTAAKIGIINWSIDREIHNFKNK